MIEAVRVPPSACSTSQSIQIVLWPSLLQVGHGAQRRGRSGAGSRRSGRRACRGSRRAASAPGWSKGACCIPRSASRLPRAASSSSAARPPPSCRADHPGLAEGHQHRARGVGRHMRDEGDRAELVGAGGRRGARKAWDGTVNGKAPAAMARCSAGQEGRRPTAVFRLGGFSEIAWGAVSTSPEQGRSTHGSMGLWGEPSAGAPQPLPLPLF